MSGNAVRCSFYPVGYCTYVNRKIDYLDQFIPSKNLTSPEINLNERRRIYVGLSKVVKGGEVFALKEFSLGFFPSLLVKIMKMFNDRIAARAFVEFSFRDDSEDSVKSGCILAHLLATEKMWFLSQDVISCVLRRIGPNRARTLVDLMWKDHNLYQSDFSVLDSVFRSLLHVGMVFEALEVLGRIRKERLKPSLSAVSILIKLLFKKGEFPLIWKLFRDLISEGPYPSVRTFNVLILGFCSIGDVTRCENLLHIMPKFHCEPDVFSYNIVINANCNHHGSTDGFKWLSIMVNRGCNPNIVTFNTVLHALCKEGNVKAARKLFDEMLMSGIKPNTKVYNVLIDGYMKAREIDLATSLYFEMRRKGVEVDCITLNILIAGYHRYGREEELDRLLNEVEQLVPVTVPLVVDLIISSLCWDGKLLDAMTLLHSSLEKGVPPNVVVFNSIIAGYSKAGMEIEAFNVYSIMTKFGLTPSASTCNSLLLCLCKKQRLKEARNLMCQMIEMGCQINEVAFTILMDGYFRINDEMAAQNIWNDMKLRKIYPDVVAFSSLINGLCKTKRMDKAQEVFIEMTLMKLVPNNFVYNSLISGYCKLGNLQKASKLESEMRQNGLFPDIFTSNIIMDGYCNWGGLGLANNICMQMSDNLVADIVTYNTTLAAYCRKNFDTVNNVDVLEFLFKGFGKKMFYNGCDPDVWTFNIWIHGLCKGQQTVQAMKLLQDLSSLGIVPNTVTYNTMMNGICSDILDRAMILTGKFLKMAFLPNIVTINILLSHLCRHGLRERAFIWAERLKEVSFVLDDATYSILKKAYQNMQECEQPYDINRALFVDFLMHFTFEAICRNIKARSPILAKLIEASLHAK